MHYKYKAQSVCAQVIDFDLDGESVSNIVFTGGCNGNLKALAKLLNGKNVTEIEDALKGNTCGAKSTSCADQLCIGLRKALSGELEAVS
ncbi:MAG: TIGR03905 family TSCPD domain-containing protein [Lachnospiraceae bacterium]|nr:TIGR03905 family TSCPD domain-containing protein [Lachnospiraceae bacterium]